MKKIIFLLMLLGLWSGSARATNAVFISQNGTGDQSGLVDCSHAKTVGYFNSAANWVSVPSGAQIGPGTTVHLCDKFNGGVNSTLLNAQGSGSSVGPVIIFFEPGAVVQAPYFSYSGGVNINGRGYIIIDGGTNGLVQNTANGSNLANQQPSVGIGAGSCNNCEIRNLTIANIYVHVPNDTAIDQTLVQSIQMSGSNWLVHDNVIRDSGWAVRNFYSNGDNNVRVYNNDIYNIDHGYIPAGSGPISASNFFFYNNHVHDYKNWDTGTANRYHHDGVHAFGVGGANLTNLQVYGNTFDGDTGANFTSHVYIERPDGSVSETNPLVFNNIFDGTKQPGGNFGMLGIGAVPGAQVYNNTFVGLNNNASYCILLAGGNTTLKNNITSGCWAGVYFYSPAPSSIFNNNTYASLGSCGIGYSNSANCYNTLASWQSFMGQDANSQVVPSANFGLGYTLASNSPAINACTNLTSLGIAGLNVDKNGAPRVLTGPWSCGAFNSNSAPPAQPKPPTGLATTVN